MSDGGQSDADLMRLWLEDQTERLGDAAHSVAWDRAEALFQAWSGLLASFGPTAARTASPFDPSEWLKPADSEGMALLADSLGNASGLLRDPGPGREAWQAWSTALERHRAITGAAWLAAFREFAERSRRATAQARRKGAEPPDRAALEALWQDIADAEFARTMASEAYLTSQAKLLQAGLELRRGLRNRIEALAELAGLPTRTEIDDMAREIHRLRRELRQLGRTTLQ